MVGNCQLELRDFWVSPDMLGLLLGLLGPAPAGATKRNFYLPLTAMFSKWCQRLCSARLPTVVQCTWSTADGRYCLGAIMSGHDGREEDNWVMASSADPGKVLGDSE